MFLSSIRAANNILINKVIASSGNFDYGYRAESGLIITEELALKIATVNACVTLISTGVASVPLNVYKINAPNDYEISYDHWLSKLLNGWVNPIQDYYQFREWLTFRLALLGNVFCFRIPLESKPSIVSDLLPMSSNDVLEMKVNDSWEPYYRVQLSLTDRPTQPTTLTRREIFHVHALSSDGLIGRSKLADAVNTIGVASAIDRHVGKSYKDGLQVSGFFEYPGVMDDEEFLRFQTDMKAKYQGPNSTGLMPILEGGMKFVKNAMTMDEALAEAVKNMSVIDIARHFLIPASKLGVGGSQPRANMEQIATEYVDDTLSAWGFRETAAFDTQLLGSEFLNRQYFTAHDFDERKKGTLKDRFEAYSKALAGSGFLRQNEVRSWENLPQSPDGNDIPKPLNMSNTGGTQKAEVILEALYELITMKQ